MKQKVEDPQKRHALEEASPETLTGVSHLRQEHTNKDNTEGNIASTSNPDKDIILVEADVHDGMEGPTNKKVEVVDLEEVSDRDTI